jgi:hypothetical protein
MNIYVVGAGVSHQVSYPLGGALFSCIDSYIRDRQASLDRKDYATEWPKLCRWLKSNPDSLVRAAYITGNIENIFTALDFARKLRYEGQSKVARSSRKSNEAEPNDAEADSKRIDQQTDVHLRYSCILRWALVKYFGQRHQEDLKSFKTQDTGWQVLRRFGEKVKPGDVVITFNYDATLERILLEQGKWNPFDGYGFGMIQLLPGNGAQCSPSRPSAVPILHLHGSFGWYTNFSPSQGRGPYISLSADLLHGLGIEAEDVTWKENPASSNPTHVDPIVIHPSFFKDYNDWTHYGTLPELWREAAEALRAADRIYIVCYSLPAADSAALTFLVTNCNRNKVEIIERDKGTCVRLRQLLGPCRSRLQPTIDFKEWVETAS